MDIRPIRTETDYEWALQEIGPYFEREPQPGTSEADRFDILATLIESYERQYHAIETAEPVDVVRLYMEQNSLTQSDLAAVLGSRSRASEFLAGRRDLSLARIDAIRTAWGIPADLLIRRQVTAA
ncbi:helix-turn-helix domain-containing protein [Acidisoma silvae]|uniref:Helix-turn-helix domain-containing protein n=1 Tax=Acidisoma silvae TaxID=2802396 RepID=A0A963YUN5_9PROT|nr:helix-turn-helix domain-containing protein [Acidisoma silvae]MCB8876740.1 helix-turn-helix domain-containing protein [Acidisoma silvae]